MKREDLTRANASLSATESVAEIGGPALAGVLFQVLAAPLAIAANAVTYLVSAVFLARIRKPEPTPEPEPHARWTADVALGFSVVWRHPLVRPVFLVGAMHGLFGGIFGALYILFCLRVVGLSPAQMGLTIATGGVGALIGAATAGWMSNRLGLGPALLVGQVLVAASVCLIPLAPADPERGMAVLVAGQLLGDAFGVAILILSSSLWQTVMPSAVLGRAGAAFKATWGGLAVVGALGGGLLGEVLGVRAAMWIAVAGFAAAPLLALSLKRLREMPAGPG